MPAFNLMRSEPRILDSSGGGRESLISSHLYIIYVLKNTLTLDWKAVIRFRKYNRDPQPSDYFRAKLMLYFSWQNEEADLLGGHSSYQAHYQAVSAAVLVNERKYNQVVHDPYEVLESGPPQHIYGQILHLQLKRVDCKP